jgi:hypothetical protein
VSIRLGDERAREPLAYRAKPGKPDPQRLHTESDRLGMPQA